MSDDSALEQAVEEAFQPPKVEASAWRVASSGPLITSVVERHVADLAELDSTGVIYFYAELGSPTELTNTEETMAKVYQALGEVGLSEGQIINAVSAMQNSGILFRERAI